MKARIKNFFNLIAGSLMSLLGFSSCDLIFGVTAPKAEYGMPHADYKIIGNVEGADGPLQGIEVKYRRNMGTYTDENGQQQPNYLEQSFTTDRNGRVNGSLSDYDTRLKAEDVEIHLTDVDGEKNGLYEPMVLKGGSLDVSFEEDKEGRFHKGTYVIGFSARMKAIIEFPPAEYGTPHAEYRIIGTVKDSKGKPIPGIEVLAALWRVDGEYQEQGPITRAETAADGTFSASMNDWPGFNVAKLTLNDIDGAENGGSFKSGEASASFTQTAEGDGHWDEGSFEANAGNIVLKK